MTDNQQILDALNSPIRRDILWRIWDRELSAGDIASGFDLTAPTISEHLSILRNSGLVTVRAAGTFRYYRARRDLLRGVQSLFAGADSKWLPADDLPERASAQARTDLVVIASTDVPLGRDVVFTSFTDADLYSLWLGVPVSIDSKGNFACKLEWGTTVRGVYSVVHPPELIVMQWDFEDDHLPIPGGQRDAYARFSTTDFGCHVEVHQLVSDEQQADFMKAAWTMVLGRLCEGIEAAVAQTAAARRKHRPKTSHIPSASTVASE